MAVIFDFLTSALPWVAMGLLVACSGVMAKAKSEGKEVSRLLAGLSWAPAVCFLFAAILEVYGGNSSGGTTWLILGMFNAVINFANTQKENK